MGRRESRIHGSIQVLWERGWIVNAENVRKMCANGAHLAISLEEAEEAILSIASGQKEQWLAHFNPVQAPGHTSEEWAKSYESWLKEPERNL